MCAFLMIIIAFDLSALVRYITRFTEESFAMLIAIIFIYEAFKKQFQGIDKYPVNFHPDEPLDNNCTCYPPIEILSVNYSYVAATTVSAAGVKGEAIITN